MATRLQGEVRFHHTSPACLGYHDGKPVLHTHSSATLHWYVYTVVVEGRTWSAKCFFKRLHKAQLLLRGEISPQDHTCTTTDVRQDGPVLSCCFCQILSLYRKSPEARKFLKYYNYRTPSAMLRYVPLITAQPRSDAWLELAGHLSHIPKCSCCHVIGWLYSGMQMFGQPC